MRLMATPATLTLEYEKITHETKINKNPNNVKQKIDQEQLKNIYVSLNFRYK